MSSPMPSYNILNSLKHINVHVDRMLSVLGEMIYIDDEEEVMVALNDKFITCLGDDSWGAVTSMFVAEGHLVLVATFGDDGYVLFSPTIKESTDLNNDLPVDFRESIGDWRDAHNATVLVHSLMEYSINQSFSIR